MDFYVEVVKIETDEVVKRLGPHGERAAERIERGLSINMNHQDYFTRIVKQAPPTVTQVDVDWNRQDIDRRKQVRR